jgi:hypothetical protein
MIQDLISIKNENDEVVRYAGVLLRDGADAAEKSRKLTRYVTGAATPNRERSYINLNILVRGVTATLIDSIDSV